MMPLADGLRGINTGTPPMFTDPISDATINSVALDLPRIRGDGYGAEYETAVGDFKLIMSHTTNGKRRRHLLKINQKKTTTDPFIPAQNVEVRASAHIVIDEPLVGFSDAELGYLIEGLTSFLAGDTGGNTDRFVAGES